MALKKDLTRVALSFTAVLIFYVLAWSGMEYLRTHNGPWEIQFSATDSASAQVTINQHSLGITNAVIHFTDTIGLTPADEKVVFDTVSASPPFGKFFYQDLTFLPGVVTLQIQGHLIELRPRNLVVNTNQIPWNPAPEISLSATTNTPPITYSNVPGFENQNN